MVELTVLGISLQEEGSIPILLLMPHASDRVFSLHIGPMEAFAVSTALQALDESPAAAAAQSSPLFPRPLTHDLLCRMVRSLGATLTAIEIHELLDGAFIADAVLQKDGATIRVDCRPSDGVALALRCGARIFAAKKLLPHTDDTFTVLENQPDHVRTVLIDKLLQVAPDIFSRKNAVERALIEALPHRREGKEPALTSPGRELLREEQQQQRDAAGEQDTLERLLSDIGKTPAAQAAPDAPETPEPGGGRKGPRIRVSLVRQGEKGSTELPSEFTIPHAPAVSDDVLAALGFSSRELENAGTESNEKRWSRLLRILSPATKVPM